jgi:YVTN family beta-propeller protein
MDVIMRRSPHPILGALLLALTLAVSGCTGGAADPGTLVVLSHTDSGEVRFMQIGSGRVTERVSVGGAPGRLVRDTARGRVYVADQAGDSVTAIDVVARAAVLSVPVGREPRGIALSPDGRRLYVAVAGEGAVAVVDLESLTVTSRIVAGNRPSGVAVSSDGSRVFVANEGDNTIAAVDPNTGRRFQRPVTVPGGVSSVFVLSSDGRSLLVGLSGRAALGVMAIGGREVREIPLGSGLGGSVQAVLPTADGRFWLVASASGEALLTVPPSGGEPSAIAIGEPVSGFAVAPGGRVLVTSRDGVYLVEVDLDKSKATRRIRVGVGHADVTVFSRATLESLRSRDSGAASR